MVYIGVEHVDHYNNRRKKFIALVPYELTDEKDIPFDGGLYQEFDDFVEDGLNPDWTEEQKEEYYELCEWFWWFLDDDEIAEIEKIRSKL